MAKPNYSKKIGIPQFEPTGRKVSVSELVNPKKYLDLVEEINRSESEGKISANEARFLRLGATRWLKFNYANIAEYYASSENAELQRLIERSALVVIDVDDALAAEVVSCREFVENMKNTWQNTVGNQGETTETPPEVTKSDLDTIFGV